MFSRFLFFLHFFYKKTIAELIFLLLYWRHTARRRWNKI